MQGSDSFGGACYFCFDSFGAFLYCNWCLGNGFPVRPVAE